MKITSSWLRSNNVIKIFKSLDNNARFVGGCVRNAIMDFGATDIDIATPFEPDEVMQRLKNSGIKSLPTGIKHGTVTAVIDKETFEITTLRKDIECTGRKAVVEFTDNWQEDAARRDFTINAMYADINGNVYDYFDGLNDIKKQKIRFVGDAKTRCTEDYLRILRFFRFLAWYGKLPADKSAVDACATYAKKIKSLSGERIQSEMIKLFSAKNPLKSLKLMDETNILSEVMGNYNIEILENIIKLSENPIIRIAAILRNKKSAEKLASSWKLSNKDKNSLINLCLPKIKISDKNKNEALYIMGRDGFVNECIILSAINPTKKDSYKKLIKYAENFDIPVFPLNGSDLQKIGYKQGKELGVTLKSAEKWWITQDFVPTKKALIDYIKTL